jgi:hypothetical protein
MTQLSDRASEQADHHVLRYLRRLDEKLDQLTDAIAAITERLATLEKPGAPAP